MRNSLLRCGYVVKLCTIHISESVLFFTSMQWSHSNTSCVLDSLLT